MLEILIVVAVTGLLMGITMLSISLIFSRQLDGDTRKLLADICYARELALSRHIDHIVTISTANETYTITDASGNTVRPTQTLKVNISSGPSTITFQPPFAEAVFNPSGSTIITLTKEGKQKQIGIRAETGYAKIE